MDAIADARRPLEMDLHGLVRNARAIDRLEWEAMTGEPMTVEGLRDLVGQSRNATALFLGGQLVAIGGVQVKTRLDDTGAIWLLGTTAMQDRDVRRAFVRGSVAGLERFGSGFRAVWNAVATQNRDAVRWLKWLGFNFDNHSLTKVRGIEFVAFYKELG